MAQPNNWEADKMLDVYIHDYLVKRNLKASAKAFQEEGKVSSEPVAIDAPGGFLFEWWSVFWDIFIARTNEKHSEVAASYIETQSLKARERYQQQQMSQQQQQQQMQMQQMLLRQQQQQQQQQQQRSREGGPLLNGSPNGLMNNNSLIRQNQGTANAMAAKIYEECLKLPPKDSVDEGAVKGFGDNVSQLLNQNNMLKNANSTGQPSGSVLHSTAGLSAGLQQVQIGSQQLTVATQDIKTEMNTVLGQSSGTSEGFLFGASGTAHSKPNLLSPGTSQEGSNPPLRGWPLTGIDPLRSSLLQPQKPFMQSSQQYNLQMLPPQQQQRLLMQAQANSNLNDVDSRRIQMLLNRNAIANKDGQPNAIGDVTQKVGSPSLSPMARPDMEMLLKMKMAQMQLLQQQQLQQQQQQQRQQLQHEEGNNLQQPQQEALSNQHSQVTSHQQQQDDKVGVANGTDGSVSNSFRGNEQGASKSQNGRKRKRPGSSSGPANSSGTANTAGPSLSSPPSTPSNQTSGDVMNMAGNLQHSGSSSNPLTMYASEGQGILASPSNPLADMDPFVDDGSLEDNVESFFVA